MNTTLIRAGVGLGTVGGVIGGGYFLNQQLSTENVEKKLLANEFEILDKKSKEWDEILKEYQATVAENINSNLKFGDFKGEPGGGEALKAKCDEALKDSSSNKNLYEKAKKWCTKTRTLTDVLKKEDFKPLTTEDKDDSKDIDEWNIKLDAYVKSKEENKKFGDTKIPKEGATLKKNKEERDEIKKKCKELEGKKHYEKDFEKELEKAKLWCAIENKDKK